MLYFLYKQIEHIKNSLHIRIYTTIKDTLFISAPKPYILIFLTIQRNFIDTVIQPEP